MLGNFLRSFGGTAVHNTGSGAYNFTTVGVDGEVTHTTVENLTPYTRYAIVLQAFNSRGAGPSSPPVFAITLQDSEYDFYNL